MRLDADAGAVALGALLAFGVFVWARIEDPGTTPPAPPATVTASRAVSDVPRIGLERVDAAPSERPRSGRDVFDFGAEPRPRVPPAAAATLSPAATLPPAPMAPTPPPVPPLNVKFIGCLNCVEGKGQKVALLMTEHKEILTAQAGEVVANRLRVVRIGLESVDVQDVGGGATRRLPLRAN